MEELVQRALTWAEHDPDPQTATQLREWVRQAQGGSAEAVSLLSEAMAGPLQFGTAGLRGRVGPGESRMNLAVVIRATAGLCAVLKARAQRVPTLVVGCDARHGSSQFVRAVARVASGAGVRVLALPPANPTPLTAFAIRHYNADAAVMVTASHNPAPDNGYKVYLGGSVAQGDGQGVQIVTPFDAEIARAIDAAPPADLIPHTDALIEDVDPSEEYLRTVVALASGEKDTRERLHIVVTPMHGVGGALTCRALAGAGFTRVSVVDAQARPDPDFPTVPFPNPEEAGALDLAMQQAARENADLIIAVDPDADRCALAVPSRGGQGWSQLSGDQIGSLVGEYLASRGVKGTFVNSIVSSRLLGKIAAAHDLEYATALTGFKWIARVPGLAFGYEEAIGFCPDPSHVRDKDGIGTAVVAASLFAQLKEKGVSAWEELDRLARLHGLYVTTPLTFRVSSLERIGEGMRRLRANPPVTLASSRVVEVADLSQGYEGVPPTDGILVRTEAGDRVVVRPSGTEPKLKCYLEVVLPVSPGEPIPWEDAHRRLECMKEEFAQVIGL